MLPVGISFTYVVLKEKLLLLHTRHRLFHLEWSHFCLWSLAVFWCKNMLMDLNHCSRSTLSLFTLMMYVLVSSWTLKEHLEHFQLINVCILPIRSHHPETIVPVSISRLGMGDTKKFLSRYIMTEIITIIDSITV